MLTVSLLSQNGVRKHELVDAMSNKFVSTPNFQDLTAQLCTCHRSLKKHERVAAMCNKFVSTPSFYDLEAKRCTSLFQEA